ncbi:MAG: hypothetical protein ACLRFN_03265 [Alphaproteobacteria bacterium]
MDTLKQNIINKSNRHFTIQCFVACMLCVLFQTCTSHAETIEDKTSQFDDIFSETLSENSSADNTLAEQIRAQRAALDSADEINNANTQAQRALAGGANACDSGLRTCMKKKCGDDFSKCAGDGDTIWGDKMDSCRRDLPCTGHEYQLLAAEIKADRDINAQLSLYNSIIDCGNKYNDCIITQCGTTFTKCLGKSAGDKAISACAKIAKSCTEQDSGLSARAMEAFGALRENAEIMVQRDEERLYELRDKMAETCKRLGASFDERTLDCVYTVNFYAGEDNTLYASKKRYAGSTFDCTPNWFGIDVTTFMENAMRLTREQTSASSAMLGSGLGIAAGAITSGAIDRAVDSHKAKKELNNAKKDAGVDKKSQRKAEREEKKAEKAERKAEKKNKKDSEKADNNNNPSTEGDKSANKSETNNFSIQGKSISELKASLSKSETNDFSMQGKSLSELKNGTQASLSKIDTPFKTSGLDTKSVDLKVPDFKNLNLNSIKQ